MNWKLLKNFLPIILFIIIIILSVFLIFSSSYTAIVKNTQSQYFQAKIFYITGNKMLCWRSDKEFIKKSHALQYNKNFHLSVESMLDISYIEIIPEEDEDPIEDGGYVHKEHLGTYTIYVTGHTGLLYFYMKNDKAYGILRFPNWAKGTREYLKGVRITQTRIQFIRSIRTASELRRIGANSYFIQKFYGKFTKNGRKIEGVYYNNGIKSIWEARKMK